MRRKQHIYKVNLRGLLLGGGIQLQQRRDGDGLSKQPLSLLGDAVPEGIRLAIVDVPQLVYLPEDDTAVARHAQPVALCGTLHLLHGQIPHANTWELECDAESDVGWPPLLSVPRQPDGGRGRYAGTVR